MIDLHVHTRCSDGSLEPCEVVRYAADKGLRALAITDHDTVDGNAEALRCAAEIGVEVIPGVEISTEWYGITFHMLGYGMTQFPSKVRDTFQFLVDSRRQRNPRMVEKLQALGLDVTLAEVRAEAASSVVGRPHFATVLLQKKLVRSHQEAFDRYLGRGAAAYVDKTRLDPAQACALIRDAGGVPVLAHPGLIDQDHPGILVNLLEELVPLGLGGIEAYYSRHTPDQTRRYRRLATERSLLVTGGSDFHRKGNGAPDLGSGFGSLAVPDWCLDALRERLAEAG